MMRRCRNPRCGDVIVQGQLCPSCRYLARWAFALGAFVAGALVKLVT